MLSNLKYFSIAAFKPVSCALLQFNKSDGWAMASHVALSLMIAVFPFLIFAVSLTGMMGETSLSDDVVSLVFDYWPDSIAEPIVNEINAVVTTASEGYLTIGVVLALFFSSNGIEAIRVALNRAYNDVDKRSIWRQRLQSLIFVIIGAFLIFLITILLVILPIYFSFMKPIHFGEYGWLFSSVTFRLLSASSVLVALIFACHYWLPGRRRSIKRIIPGILLTLSLWIIAGKGFTFYLESFANYSAVYAGLSGIMTALIFLYVMAVIFIFGAEYNSAIEKIKSDSNT